MHTLKKAISRCASVSEFKRKFFFRFVFMSKNDSWNMANEKCERYDPPTAVELDGMEIATRLESSKVLS